MTNVIFDLSNMFFRSLYIVGGYGAKNYTFDSQYEVDQLMRKIATDVAYVIRQINPSRVIFALDSRSWRKDIPIDENEGYKGDREKSGVINWDNVFSVMKEFGQILESNGFIVTQVDKAEADDIMCLWRDELLFKQNQHVILVSADEDVRQLVAFWPWEKGKLAFSTVFNPFATGKSSSKKLYVPNHFEEWLNKSEEADIFNRAIDVDKEDFRRLKNSDKMTIEEVKGNLIALRKVFCGDDGDNVPAIYSWIAKDKQGNVLLNKKTGEPRVDRITNSKFEKIVDFIGASDYLDLGEKANLIYDQLVNCSGERPPFDIVQRLQRQIKLVVLSRTVFPEKIVEDFDENVKEQLKRPNISPQNWNMNTILEGTQYVNSNSSGNEASIFREVDRLNKELF